MAQGPVTFPGDRLHQGYLDMAKNEVRNLRLQQLSADIGTPVDGLIYYKTDTDKIRAYINGSWEDLATMDDVTAGGISAGIVDAKGDLIAGAAADAVARLPVGANGTAMIAASGETTGLLWRLLPEADVNLSTTDVLVGRDTASAGVAEEITVGGGVEFTGSGGIQRSALTGDVTASAGSATTAIAAGVIVNADVNASAAILFSKLATSNTDVILGRDTAAGGAVEEITLNSTLEFTGAQAIQRAALTGDVTATAGSNTTAIAAGVIVNADVNASAAILFSKLATSNTDRLLGRDTAAGGAVEEISLDTTLEFTGSQVIRRAALTGDVTATAGSNTTAIAAGVIVNADVNASAAIDATKIAVAAFGNNTGGTLQASMTELESDLTALITSTIEGFDWKEPVRAATTAAGTLASSFENGDAIDGITLATGDRILIKDQAAGQENGIYVVAASGAPTRASDMNVAAEANNATVLVEAGTTNVGDVYTQTANIVTIGTTVMVWAKSGEGNSVYTADESTLQLVGTQFSIKDAGVNLAGAKVTGTLDAANGGTDNASYAVGDLLYASGTTALSKLADVAVGNVLISGGVTTAPSYGKVQLSGGTVHVNGTLPLGNGGTGGTTAVTAAQALSAARYASGSLTGGANSEVITHNLNTKLVQLTIRNNATPFEQIETPYNEATSVNTVTVYAGAGNNLPASYTWVAVGVAA